jgi:hypothetical protein
MEIAKANSTTVAAIDENNRIVRIDSTGAVADDRQAETTPARADVAPAPPVQQTPAVGTAGQSPAPAQAAPAPRPARTELPRTASQLGLIQVLTGLSLVGALGVRRLIRRRI